MWKLVFAAAGLLASCQRGPAGPGAPAPSPVGPSTLRADRPPSAAAPVAAAAQEAAQGRLPDGVRPLAYALQLDVDPRSPGFHGHTRIDVQLDRAVASIALHARELELARVSLAVPGTERVISATARALPGRQGENGLTELVLAEPIGPGASRIEIDYAGQLNQRLSGMYQVDSGGDRYVFTQFEPIDARRAFPCFDEPRFKTPFDLTLRVPTGQVAIANTPIRSQTELASRQTEVSFLRTEKLPTYLVAFAVGPLDVVDGPPLAASAVREQALPLRGVAARGRGPELAFALQETPRLVESLERYFAVAYPYPKLDLIAVPDFAAGAMENAGAITFRDTLLLLGSSAPEGQRRASVSVNAHELAHQWFGDLVTMPWWDDIWLNEGFATWLSARVLEEVHPEYRSQVARVAGLERAFDMDGRLSARQVRQPIASDHDIGNAFDAITYIKGAALLAMFERYLGAEAFRAGLRSYLQLHRFGSGRSSDLLAALEQSSGKPVAAAFSSFLDQPGVPTISMELRCAAGVPPSVHLRQRRFTPLGSGIDPARRWQVPVCVRHDLGGGTTREHTPSGEQCLLLDSAEADLELNQEQCPGWLFPNARAAGYYRWSLGAAELSALLEQGYASLDSGERLSLLSNAEAAARSGEQPLAPLLAVARRLGSENERELVAASLDVLQRVREALLGEPELPGYRRLVRQLVAGRQQQLGLYPAAKEDGETKLLRTELVSALAFEARDAGLRRELSLLGRARLGLARDARIDHLPSELLEIALAVAVQEGGQPVMERALAALAKSNDGIERNRLLSALGSNLNPELSSRVLEISLSDGLRTNERLSVIFGQIQARETRDAGYAWLEQHFDALVARLGNELGAQLVRVAGAFCSTAAAERARQFLAPRVEALLGGPRLLRLGLEASESCAAFADAQRRSAHEYFTNAVPPSREPVSKAALPKTRPL
jgi:alanyl aminopeptidase